MKNLIILLAFISITCDMDAGWNTTTRRKCRTFSKKYVARASVFTGLINSQRTAGCGDVYAETIKDCAWQMTSNGPSGAWQQGGVKNNFCSRGERISRLERFLLPSFYSLTTEYVEESNFSNKEIIFDEINNKIIINGMTGFIKLQKGNGYFSNLRVAIWKPADDLINEIEDEQMDDKEIVDYFEISVTDRGIIFNGKLVSEELKKQFVVARTLGFVINTPERSDLQ